MSVPSATSMVHLSHPRPLRLAPFTLTWVALLTLALGLVGCGGRAPTGEPAHGTSGQEGQEDPSLAGVSRAPTDQERRIIQGLMRDASRVRNLAFLHEGPTEIQDEARIRAFVEADIEPDELAESRDLYTSLGLLPDDVDLEALLLEVLGEQIVGYYDPDGGRLVVRDDVMRSLAASSVDEARVVLDLSEDGLFMEDPDLVRRVRMACYRVRALGSAAIHFREIASGILDAYLGGRGTPTPLHDLGPGLLLVREAGGRDSDGAGGDPLVSQHVVVAGAPRVHDGLVALLGRDG